jgi:hypothetical protein
MVGGQVADDRRMSGGRAEDERRMIRRPNSSTFGISNFGMKIGLNRNSRSNFDQILHFGTPQMKE